MANHAAVNLLQFRAEDPWINWVSHIHWELFFMRVLSSSAVHLKIKRKGCICYSTWVKAIVLHFSLWPYLSHSNSAPTATYESVLLTVGNTFVQVLFRAAHNEKNNVFLGTRCDLHNTNGLLATHFEKWTNVGVSQWRLSSNPPPTTMWCSVAVVTSTTSAAFHSTTCQQRSTQTQ